MSRIDSFQRTSRCRSRFSSRVACAAVCAGVVVSLAFACPVQAQAGEAGDAAQQGSSLRDALRTPAEALELTPAALSEEELDLVVGSYTFRGELFEVTAREAIEDTVSLKSVQNEDGTYAAPTADMILTCMRNQILAKLVEQEGVEVTDDEVAAYAEQSVGTGDVELIAQYYGMDTEQAWRILRESAAVVKLRDQVAGTVPAAPQAPVAPADGEDASTATAEYGAYVLDVAGAAWDAETVSWADPDGAFAQALAAQEFDGVQASYEAAQIAFYVAYSLYQEQAAAQRGAWADYVNQYLGEAGAVIATLRS